MFRIHARRWSTVVVLLLIPILGCHAIQPSSPDGSRSTPDAAAVSPDAGMSPDASMPADGSISSPTFAWRNAAPCPVPLFEAQSAVVADKLYVMGGFTSGSLAVTTQVHSYDPATDQWTQEMDLPGAQTHVGVVVNGTEIWLIGGLAGPGGPWVTTVEVWHQPTPQSPWQMGTSLPTARAAMAAVLVDNAIHAVAGLAADGQTDSSEHTVLDLANPVAWTNAPAPPNPRNHLGGAAVSGLMYVVGGRHGWDEAHGNQASLDSFDSATQLWTTHADIPLARSEINAATFASANQLVVVGGSVNPVTPSADVFSYDPAADLWSRLPSLPGPRKGAVAARIGNQIVVTTGSPTGTDPDATTWIGCCLSP